MQGKVITADEHVGDHGQDTIDVLGFWLYIMTDCILFGTLFATFIVLSNPGMHGPSLKPHIDLPYTLAETFLLLGSNFTFCLATLDLHKNEVKKTLFWLLITFILGASFVGLEINEFYHVALAGFRWDESGQASSFFALVGTHGLHVTIGLCWIILMMFQIPIMQINNITKRRMTYLGLFWNFLDIVWIFLFTIVYLLGALL